MKRKQIVLMVSMILLVLAVGLFVVFKNSASIAAITGTCSEKDLNGLILVPLGGRIECEALKTVPIDHIDDTSTIKSDGSVHTPSGMTAKCGDNEVTPLCDKFIVACDTTDDDTASQHGVDIVMKTDNPQFSSQCGLNSNSYCDTGKDGGSNQKIIVAEDIELGSYSYKYFCKKWYLFVGDTFYPGNVYVSYVPYGLNMYEQDIKTTLSTTNCNINGLSTDIQNNICAAGSDPNANNQYTCKNDGMKITSGTIPYDNWINYISKWVVGPAEMNSVTYNNQKAYCGNRKIYSLETISLKSGCYQYPGTQIGSVTCCPGEVYGDTYCSDDFKWVSGGKACYSDLDCGSSNTDAICDVNTFKLTKYTCQTDATSTKKGYCKASSEKTVACCPPNYGCTNGVCDISTFTCTQPNVCNNNKVCEWEKGETAYNCPGDCAQCNSNDVCEAALGENATTCPSDCGEDYTFWIIVAVLAVIIIGLGYMIMKKNSGGGF